MKRRALIAALVAGALTSALAAPVASAAVRHDISSAAAPGAPGDESYFDLARKDCVGTARNDRSKVWFTVADGALSDVYWPTVDATNVHSLQYLVSDGRSFTDLQTRDMTYSLIPDPTGMSCTVVASDAARHYSITTTYIADPQRDDVLMRVRFDGPRRDRVYVRLDPLAGGTGGGGTQNAGGNSAALAATSAGAVPVAFNANTTTDAVNRSYAVPTYEALESARGFGDASVGYAGTASDGLTMLDAGHRLTTYGSAPDGHVTLTAALPLWHGRSTTLALGFGTTQSAALATARAGTRQRFDRAWRRYEGQWGRYDSRLNRPSSGLGASAVREYYASVNVVKASEDKTFPGAIAAGLASPWGQAVPAGNLTNGRPTYFGSYREVFARDLYEAFTGLLVAGDVATARSATTFLFDRQQQSDGSMPRNSLENGKPAPDTGGLQLDETSYPILMAWQAGLAADGDLYRNHIIPAADFLVAHGPSDGVERWEEQSGYSPSTIAAEIAGLTAAAHIASVNHDTPRADIYQATADDFARNITNWDVTSTGPWSSVFGVSSYFIRLSKNGDPNNADSYGLGNGVQGTFDQRSVVDAGFLDLVRLGILPASDPVVQSSIKVIDGVIQRSTSSGIGFYRYGASPTESDDGYGDCYQPSASSCSPPGTPWPAILTDDTPSNIGTGHLWPVLSGERGEYEVAAGDPGSARSLLQSMQNMQSGQGLEPEQAWENPPLAANVNPVDGVNGSIGFVNGKPAGSASPLTWAQAQYARLALALSAGHNLETPAIVSDRYAAGGIPGALPLTITAPAAGTNLVTSPVTVTGTTAAGATVDAASVGSAGGTAAVATTTADGSGAWSLSLPTSFGTDTITVTASRGNRTAYAQTNVNYFVLPGNQVLTVTDPSGDDNGPGTYQYPTASDFSPGAFDLLGMSVNQTPSDVYLTVKIRNLANTFGNAFGAQLLDIYVHQPGGGTSSTAAAYPLPMNYTVAPADAWSERLEAQGFASPTWVDASGNSLGAAQMIEDQAAGTVTLVMPTSAFGTVVPGWAFTIALAGQGSGSPPVRNFTATAGQYSFGVCAAGATDPICSVDPANVAAVLDTIPPSGVSQPTEWDTSTGAAVLQGVTVP